MDGMFLSRCLSYGQHVVNHAGCSSLLEFFRIIEGLKLQHLFTQKLVLS
jgi:hypothetical protein